MDNLDVINIGIVGLGRVALRHAKAIGEIKELKLWNVCSRQIDTAEEFHKNFQASSKTPAYDNFKLMIADPKLHAVIIATPDQFHFSYASEALKHGKHLFIEKPLCTEISEGKQLLALAANTNCVVAMGYNFRWHPGMRLLANKIHANELGEIRHINIHWAHTFIEEAKWRKSSNLSRWWSITTLGTHCLDLIRWLLVPTCGEIKNIKTLTTNNNFKTNDETALISIQFESGATASIYTSILFNSEFSLEVFGEKHNAKALNVITSKSKGSIVIDGVPLEYKDPENFYACELRNFALAIQNKSLVEVTLQEGFRNIELLINSSEE